MMNKQATNAQKWLLKRPQYRLVIRLMLSGLSIAEIARKTKIPLGTLYRLRRRPEFELAVRELEDELFSESDRMLRHTHHQAACQLRKAVKKLGKLIDDDDPNVVFEAVDRLVELSNMKERVGRLQDSECGMASGETNLVEVFEENPEVRRAAMEYVSAIRQVQDVNEK